MAKILEIEFKGGRKAFYANPQEFPFTVGDLVIVQAEKGEDLGSVINMGSLVDKRAGNQTLPEAIRKPNKKDLARKEENSGLEEEAFQDCLKRIEEHGLDMKLVDVEYQFDRNKTTFFFTSENRVDFRALVRDLARRYHTRIELRQIGVRDEAKRIGGVGVCGRGLCCTTFLREFEPVVTQLAKDQNLALNPTKLSGCCGRLMCCLRYEEAFYAEMLKKFPPIESKLRTDKGTGQITSIDIFSEKATIKYQSGEHETFSLEQINAFLNNKFDKRKQDKKHPDQKREDQRKQDHRNKGKNHPDSKKKPEQQGDQSQEDRKDNNQAKQQEKKQDRRNRSNRRYRGNRKKSQNNKNKNPQSNGREANKNAQEKNTGN